ncbi:hypothetical protein GCK72_023992 [Caenorhabditis remanei]|uniref:Uncharacterized protein n=1 Tax=Caenorhabditis remanei TaxID=31234 RepID=A0A6A5FYA8_CAERE|nr:hypothetical protein GCK72_023992 [Caenorhabditis remanei]KAF1747527.1 hypothetical protein GCK72_023992 [Caenorhabditis remanei]
MMQEVDELKIINTVRDYTCIKEFFERFSCHPAVPDHIHYFFPNLDRIAVANYIPTPEDLIHMRQTTLGVHEISFDYTKHTIRLIDVGGQKTERRKWIHFFEGVTAVMFTCSLASFNQTTEEEPKSFVEGNGLRKQSIPAVLVSSWESSLNKVQNRIMVRSSGKARVEKPGMINRLDEAVELFRSIRENHFLRTSTFMLFLNKVDLLAKKLSIIRFSEYFPDYKKWINGDNSVASVAEFIESMFREGLEPDQKIYAHLIQATVTTNVEFTFALCCDVIFERNLEGTTLE